MKDEDWYYNELFNHSALLKSRIADMQAETEMLKQKPSVILRPKLYIDGDFWCALYGDNIQDGVCGFGKSPSDAYADFDSNWYRSL